MAVLRLEIASCFHLKSGSKTPALQKLGLGRFGWRWRLGCRGRSCVWRGGRRPGCVCGASSCTGCGCWARGLRACGAAGEGHERDVAGALDGYAEPALVARADAGHAARENLAALLHELRKDVGALVVDEVHLLDAKLADLFLAEVLALAATMTAGAAFAARGAAGGLRLLWFICHNCLPF